MSFANKHPWLCSGLSALAITLSSFSLGNTLGPSITKSPKVKVTEGLEDVLETKENDKYNLEFYSFPTVKTDFNGDGIPDTYSRVKFNYDGYAFSITYGIAQGDIPEDYARDVFIGPASVKKIGQNEDKPYNGLMYVIKDPTSRQIEDPIKGAKAERVFLRNNGNFEIGKFVKKKDFTGDGMDDTFYDLTLTSNTGRTNLDFGVAETGKGKDPDIYSGSVVIQDPKDKAHFSCGRRFSHQGAIKIPDPIF